MASPLHIKLLIAFRLQLSMTTTAKTQTLHIFLDDFKKNDLFRHIALLPFSRVTNQLTT